MDGNETSHPHTAIVVSVAVSDARALPSRSSFLRVPPTAVPAPLPVLHVHVHVASPSAHLPKFCTPHLLSRTDGKLNHLATSAYARPRAISYR